MREVNAKKLDPCNGSLGWIFCTCAEAQSKGQKTKISLLTTDSTAEIGKRDQLANIHDSISSSLFLQVHESLYPSRDPNSVFPISVLVIGRHGHNVNDKVRMSTTVSK